jgi:uncharacterized protein
MQTVTDMVPIIRVLHLLLMAIYIGTPPAALWLDIRRLRRRGRRAPSPQFVATVCAGITLGTCIAVAFAAFTFNKGSAGQAVIASYFATSLLFLLKGFDKILRNGLLASIARRPWMIVPASLARIVLLFGIGLPYIMAAGLTYRPKVIAHDDPSNKFGVGFEPISFDATDGTRLAGWWIPAVNERGQRFAQSTVLICHGAGVGKTSALPLLENFAPHGYNVLMFDFRAHGASGGQLVSFGDNERRDVLGAVNWVQQVHPAQSARIFGLGIDTGGAALIAAASDPSNAGHAIDAVAVYNCYNDLPELVRTFSDDRFFAPFNWLFSRVGLVMADVQTGADLTTFSPGRDIQSIWPRPVFIVNGSDSRTFPLQSGVDLFDSATEPKTCRWINGATTTDLINDADVADAVRKFFATAQPMPVI